MASHSDGDDGFGRMQHLIDEMNASNHRIDLFSKKLHDDGSELDKANPLLPKTSSMDKQFEALYDDAWRSEESDGASLQEVPIELYCNDAGDSGCEEVVNSAIAEVSNDFLSGLRQAVGSNLGVDSDESRLSSDNDVKRVTGRASYARYPETGTGLSDTDWNPYGTESDNNQSPRYQPQDSVSDSKCLAMTSFTPLFNSTDINSVTPNSPVKVSCLKEGMSDIQEQTESNRSLSHTLVPDSTSFLSNRDSTVKPLYTPAAIERKQEKGIERGRANNKDHEELSISKESISSGEEKKLIASTSSTGYSSATSAVKLDQGQNPQSEPLSVTERARQLGISEDIILNKVSEKTSRKGFYDRYSKSPDDINVVNDQLSETVKALLSETTHLSSMDKRSSVDYTVLQRDLQEIEDNLYSSQGTGKTKSVASSEGDGDVIPSTTTTPEKRKDKIIWDFAGNIGTLGGHHAADLMGEISLETQATGCQRLSSEKALYNSDGNETATSESSTKNDEHTAADFALAEMSEILHPSMRDLNSSADVERMVSSFQDKRRQLESRYQQLNNQGLAEKVFRILTNQNPDSQVSGILSEVNAQEKDAKSKAVSDSLEKNFNYSSTSSWLDEFNQSLNPQFDVRKKLDMSGLSSVDSSAILDRSASGTKVFSALDDAKRLLSSQMMKASERTFNSSVELRVPQTIQCYPLLVDSANGNNSNKDQESQSSTVQQRQDLFAEDRRQVGDRPIVFKESETGNGGNLTQQHGTDEERTQRANTSPTSSDQGANSSLRPKDKYRPYRPAGSKEVYYTESDTASVADSVTTMESTHIGSDDAKGPSLPSHALGSRKDPPDSAGIYSRMNLSTVREDAEIAAVVEEKNGDESKAKNQNSNSEVPRLSTYGANGTNQEMVATNSVSSHRRYSPSSRPLRHNLDDEAWERRRYATDNQRNETDRSRHHLSSEGRSNSSPTHGISAARREAKWEHRKDERERTMEAEPERFGASRMQSRYLSERPDHSQERLTGEDRGERKSQCAFSAREDLSRREEKEEEPLSLKIHMKYTDDTTARTRSPGREFDRTNERWNQFLLEREQRKLDQERPYLRGPMSSDVPSAQQQRAWSPTRQSPPLHRDHGLHRTASDENLNVSRVHLSPAFRQAVSPGVDGTLPRTASDEHLDLRVRDARLSPAFREALSSELRDAIEKRSPLLSRHLERSLAQPPSDYPMENRSKADERSEERVHRPNFLARERPLSPNGYQRGRPADRSDLYEAQIGADIRLRSRSASPPHGLRASARSLSPHARENFWNQRNVNSHRDGNTRLSNTSPKRKVELTLERMSSESEADLEMDQEPLSKRAQLLKSALSHEVEPQLDQDIQGLWEKFKAMNDSSSSSINSTKRDCVADLVHSPSRRFVTRYVEDREEYRIERQERAEQEKERRLKEQRALKQSSSEDEIGERYAELLAMKEEERLKRRALKKKKGKGAASVPGNEKDNLFAIPEDQRQEPLPAQSNVTSKNPKSKGNRQSHVIDPNMMKLREKIASQKSKVDREMLKEMKRIDKLKRLEKLLMEKRSGKISNETLQNQLEELSSTSAVISDVSQESSKDNIHKSHHGVSEDNTTAKDSSAEMHAWKAEKERRLKEFEIEKQRAMEERSASKGKSRTKPGSQSSRKSSEVKLLKLVKEGFLTVDEAYKLALERATLRGSHESHDSSRDSSILSNNSEHSRKPHTFYSPYSRSSNFSSHKHHIPKVKYSHSPHNAPDLGCNNSKLMHYQKDPRLGRGRGVSRRQRSHSPSSTWHAVPPRRQSSASPTRKTGKSNSQNYLRKPKKAVTKKYGSENVSPENKDVKESVSWHIPINLPASQWSEPQPKHPLQEVTSSMSNKTQSGRSQDQHRRSESIRENEDRRRDENNDANIWTRSNHPQGIPKLEWETVVRQDALASKTNHREVDPLQDRVQYILNKQSSPPSELGSFSEDMPSLKKLTSKMSLQEAFQFRKMGFISKSSERQKRIKLSREERQLQECLRLEREAIFMDHERMAPPNIYAHPYSDNLYQPKQRILTKQEMKNITAKRYKTLSEVKEKKEEDRKKMEAKLNRLRASLFNKKVQRDVLRKTLKQRSH